MNSECLIERRRGTANVVEALPPASAVHLSASSTIGARLHALVDSATATIDGAASAGLAVDIGDAPDRTEFLIGSDDAVFPLHAAEAEDGDGPGMTARRSGEVIRISSTADDGPWEPFREACRNAGIMSTASFAITVGGQRLGALTVHSPDYHAFDVEAIRTGRQLAIDLAAAIEAAAGDWPAADVAEGPQLAAAPSSAQAAEPAAEPTRRPST